MNETSLSLLDQLRDGTGGDAWGRLHSIYEPLIRTWLRKYDVQDSDADDLAQELLLAVSKDIDSFDHNGRPGAFRAWLKGILVNRLREFWRRRDKQPRAASGSEIDQRLAELDDPASQATLIWNREHDHHVLRRLLDLVAPQFESTTWEAFRKTTFEGQKANVVAADLGISLNAVFIAKSRVTSKLRQEASGLVEDSSRFSTDS